MPKPSSANKSPVPGHPDAKASGTEKILSRGNRANPDVSAEGAAGKKDSTSEKASSGSASESACSTNSSANTESTPPVEATFVPNAAPRVSIGAALCEAGFDERAVAGEYVKVVQSLGKPDSTDRGGATKLLVDVLKECSRQLDNTAGHRAGGAPVVVQLVHTVSRPVRPSAAPALTSANPSAAIEIASPCAADSSADTESSNSTREPS